MHEHAAVGFRGEDLFGLSWDLGFRREDSGFPRRIRVLVGKGSNFGKDSGFREIGCRGEDFGFSWGEIRAFVGRILSFREACGLLCGGSAVYADDLGFRGVSGVGLSWGQFRALLGRMFWGGLGFGGEDLRLSWGGFVGGGEGGGGGDSGDSGFGGASGFRGEDLGLRESILRI